MNRDDVGQSAWIARLVGVCATVTGMCVLAAFRPQPTSVADGPRLFTKVQAERGRTLYDAQCADCHGGKLEGGNSTALVGEPFFANWNRPNLTLDDFYYIVRKTMPKEAAGSLTREEYTDVVAYILQQNGFADGDEELTPDPVKLKAVRLEPPVPDTGRTTAPIRLLLSHPR